MVDRNAVFTINVFTDGDYEVLYKNEPLREIESEEEFNAILAKGVSGKESIFNAFLSYLKTRSGVIIIGGRRYVVP